MQGATPHHTILSYNAVVVIQQPTPSTGPRFRDIPVIMTDSSGIPFTTELRYVNGLFTWLVVGVTCVVAGEYSTALLSSSVCVCGGGGGDLSLSPLLPCRSCPGRRSPLIYLSGSKRHIYSLSTFCQGNCGKGVGVRG